MFSYYKQHGSKHLWYLGLLDISETAFCFPEIDYLTSVPSTFTKVAQDRTPSLSISQRANWGLGLCVCTLVEPLTASNPQATRGALLYAVASWYRRADSITQLWRYMELWHSLFYVVIFIDLSKYKNTCYLKQRVFHPIPDVTLVLTGFLNVMLLDWAKWVRSDPGNCWGPESNQHLVFGPNQNILHNFRVILCCSQSPRECWSRGQFMHQVGIFTN